MHLQHLLAAEIQAAISRAQAAGDLPPFDMPDVNVEHPRDASHGDYATATPLQLARAARMAPIKIAQAIVDHLASPPYLAAAETAPPGFINLRLDDGYVQQTVGRILEAGADYGNLPLGAGQKVQIECVSANPTGPLTLGRTRGGVIGDALGRAMRAAGFTVELEYYYNDAGRQIEILGESTRIRYLQLLGDDAKLESTHYQGQYLVDIAQGLVDAHGDGWRTAPTTQFADYAKEILGERIRASLRRIGIVHDTYFNEAQLEETGEVEQALDILRERDFVYKKDGAWWLRTSAFGDDEDRVAIRSEDNRPTYRMNDIVYHLDKAQRQFDRVIDIFGPDHHAEAPQVLWGVQMLGYDTDFVYTLLHQIVNLIRDGQQVKMSTRRGVYVTLDELVDEVGPDPIRYFFISRSANSHINFDLNLALEQSDKNPVYYIQNAHVRCAGIFRRWADEKLPADADQGADLSLLTDPTELAFLKKALELPEIIARVVDTHEPHHLTFYAGELAGCFHPMYEQSRVLHSTVPEPLRLARLRLYRAAQTLFARVLTLLGMSAPDYM